ncbi:YifB family Mg chelatase-like AAA ATPase [Dermatophilus congolensis]|uniref:YifB family Mg chelatase-like AAA ATPase n=1 Tax=Dermatophilus congolensis TaxID=1863 RepID=UPI001AAFF00C|nr:YifB family Mg chelatase-like AAA ATPase [Dermatophilus congolensis]MBO3142267.1 YifB family Mg chelatase-like AAA ATPase [Dermatophilus congolensis]MBO3151258.1 YifB family Mg chelatase-like AAA ATPase [Dermatophilus congolensis]MBO3161738.1 YifB family Mg chelatase-like AAA ATPase [Dermatophilus congolensis]MBO3162544.1 YifB family Mg chelatase-like AAA ATPase [Dermatophilus congolensis]MBO3176097.1 YifB family Mg chelatase-like AAA ATPase [Dermatophilus congolensis]
MTGLGRTCAATLFGLSGALVQVEADVSPGLPTFLVSGMPDAACRQATERVKAAVIHSGFPRLDCRVVVNLSPASLPKTGAGFDLAIAMAVLASQEALPPETIDRVLHIGELGLDGSLKPISGVLPLVLEAVSQGCTTVLVPPANAAEAALVSEARVFAVSSLAEAVKFHLVGRTGNDVCAQVGFSPVQTELSSAPVPVIRDMSDVAGQEEARFALEVAAAGGHHMALVGPPGAGKTLLAECLTGLLPPLSDAQALESTVVHSVLAKLDNAGLVKRAPFVAPHHGASATALIGGGGSAGAVRPGLISLAHNGVLFLDEAPEFKPSVLQALRQPLESGEIVVARARGSARFPARFQLVLAANPCPCGNAFGKGARCRCSSKAQRDYLGRLAGPLLDRVDVQLQVQRVSRAALRAPRAESSAVIAQRVKRARERQNHRWEKQPWSLNAHVPGPRLRGGEFQLPAAATSDIDRALDRGALTLRGYDRVLRLAWTVADLSVKDRPTREDVGLALGLRSRLGAAA